MAHVIAIDAGTSSVRCLAVDEHGAVTGVAGRDLTARFPHPGWVEQDPDEIWEATRLALGEVAGPIAGSGAAIAAIGIANQRETVVAWDRRTGRPRHRALVWQDRRTAGRCDALAADGRLPLVRRRTGLVLDPYFSATKMAWLLEEGGVAADGDLALGTVDSWLLWNLTGGAEGGVHATDTTNASRTLLYDIDEHRWSAQLCDLFGVPLAALAEVRPSCGRFGTVSSRALTRKAAGPGAGPTLDGAGPGGVRAGTDPTLAGVPVSGIAGDQHAALFGQACLSPGMAKATYGTGTFVLLNAGPRRPAAAEGLLTTVAWDLGGHGGAHPRVSYALEGSVFASGSAVQWLRDGLGVIGHAADLEPLARSVGDTGGAVVVPAFTGLGSPWWDPYARGTIVGLTRGVGRPQLARAVVEAMAHQVRDVLDAMAATTGTPVADLRVDGGAAVMDLLLELQADVAQVRVTRPAVTETTALGAAFLAGLAEGVWNDPGEVAARWRPDASRDPGIAPGEADRRHHTWHGAVERSRGWAHEP